MPISEKNVKSAAPFSMEGAVFFSLLFFLSDTNLPPFFPFASSDTVQQRNMPLPVAKLSHKLPSAVFIHPECTFPTRCPLFCHKPDYPAEAYVIWKKTDAKRRMPPHSPLLLPALHNKFFFTPNSSKHCCKLPYVFGIFYFLSCASAPFAYSAI